MDPLQFSAHTQQPGDAALIARLKEIKIFDKKWELLKDVLASLFAKESVGTIANAIERRFHFHANEEAYKYRFKRWGWTGKKNSARVPKAIKQELLSRAQKRAARGKSTVAEYQGQIIHPQRLQSEISSLSNNDNLTMSKIFHGTTGNNQHFGSYMPFSESL
ncbi:hypothetical protein LTR70_000788 [Exophiala xenobiotica]|uniref:Clr5 domain-containing protein n=1 Tax=Lithohypha guttulata TaxID=1690604 RepID=A0ABR0KN55_9EURO|nr:hypothetical protein LTR24_000538 [Lithohypha guttulata]KAK5329291.1 hypothetical protein LTR70_000788 [Exophiala xenobiotica]